uniref:Quinaldine 4-oxidase large subunit n=1 Tax=Paenarthrobacter ilicis TaxID=43665 RepID=Q7WSQ5_9MICC|nr:quinaldine 4-oxidase large subunit [Paenarthrobacter ilicis]
MVESISAPKMVGQAIPRKENAGLLTGAALFVDDVVLEGMLHAKILRSPTAHANLLSVDASRARTMPGVHDVVTGPEMTGVLKRFGGLVKGLPFNDRIVMADDKVVFEGQEIAAVAAESPYEAWDAVEAIKVAYDELEPVVDIEFAASSEAKAIWDYNGTNVWENYKLKIGDAQSAHGAVTVGGKFRTNRPAAVAMEPHVCIADFDRITKSLTLYTSTQFTHLLVGIIADVLQIPPAKVRVATLNVGGSFGSKGDLFPHEVIACLLSLRTGRPVKLVLSREEVFKAVGGRCAQVTTAELKMDQDGSIVSYGAKVLHNTGAVSPFGGQIMKIGLHIGMLPYPIPNIDINASAVSTTTISGGPVRGFGVPQVLFVKEQLIDMAAEELGLDPIEVRLKNIPANAEEGYVTPSGIRIDSTTAHFCLRKVADEIGWWDRHEKREAYVGYGAGLAVKYTSARHPSLDTDLSTIRLLLTPDGRVTIFSGDVPHGQGHHTMLSQIVADATGAKFDEIGLVAADTATTPFSLGTFGSRSAAVLGSAAMRAGELLAERIRTVAASIMKCPADILELRESMVWVKGSTEPALPFEAVAAVALFATSGLSGGSVAGPIEAQATYDTPTEREREDGGGNWAATYSAGAHAARVEVDPSTGQFKILDYVMAHDSGNIINPLIVEGQHHGGFAHGLAMVTEDLQIGSDGKLLNASLATYGVLTAHDVPNLHQLYDVDVPSTVIPIGSKGAGETATGAVPAVIANALADATGIRFTRLPITPEDVVLALAEKERQGVDRLVWPLTETQGDTQ